ncbi:hypothetical protein [Saezia sanguinis]|uniref:hypothetical protein n=1 Tax=Saezia sanguinis TaxID=1965230 RepID=UPI00304DCEF3
MSKDLKKLVDELERVLVERGGSLDAPAREAFQAQLNSLKKAVDEADSAQMVKLRYDALNMLATLLSVITNVMTLLR